MQIAEQGGNDFWTNQERIYRAAYVSIALLILNVVIFLLCISITPWFYQKGAMYTEYVLTNGEFYRLFTAIFLHADIQHLFNNMIILVLAGAIVENYTGHGFYFLLYMLSGIFGNIVSMAYELSHNLEWVSVGASGAIMGLVGFIFIWIVINRRQFIRSRSMLIRVIFLAFFVIEASFFQEGANTAAHFGGFVTGLIFGIINIVLFNNEKNMEGLA